MATTVLLDEWHLTVRIPADLPAATIAAVRRALNAKAFTAALRRAVLTVVGRRPVLNRVRVLITR